MLIVISDPEEVANETAIINELFDNGLEIFHLRKPEYTERELIALLREIKPVHLPKVALHQYHHLADRYNIRRLHFPAVRRKSQSSQINNSPYGSGRFKLSTSIHDLSELSELNGNFSYAFLGPVFDSISKPGHLAKELDPAVLQDPERDIELIGLGGIDSVNCMRVMEMGFDGVALLGAIWQSDNPLDQFKQMKEKCNTIVH